MGGRGGGGGGRGGDSGRGRGGVAWCTKGYDQKIYGGKEE